MRQKSLISIIIIGLVLCAVSIGIGVPYWLVEYNKYKKNKE